MIENSLGMKLVRVPAGSFEMGTCATIADRDHCFAERPARHVSITQPYYLSTTEVTLGEYRRFRPDFAGLEEVAPFASGMSWHEAVAFCKWLSEKEGKPYRLPTEAEWEYAARNAGQFDLHNMLSGPLEWCQDWYGPYEENTQCDPVGPNGGFARVVRGGCLDQTEMPEDYAHVTHRAGIAPGIGAYPGMPDRMERHRIGFRVVQAAMPQTEPHAARVGFTRRGVVLGTENVLQGPDPQRPYCRKRHLLPVPPDNAPTAAIDALGLDPSFRRHNHSPALTVCPNGDVLMVTYTSYHEYEPEVSLIATRLRFGADAWDMPAPLVDFPGANDHAPLLFTDGETVRLFWGNPLLPGAFPFQWIESTDSGASWSEVRFPRFHNEPGPHSRQPVNSGFRGPDGTLHVASDGKDSTSVLWASDDDGLSWFDPGGRSAGRHTTYCLLKDGAILGLGGKNTDIDGFMPAVVSRDGGRSWEKSKSAFPALGGNQRPSLLRLHSGRLFFAGDFQNLQGGRPKGVKEWGSFVAISENEGRTWRIKKLPGTQPHEVKGALKGADTLGYSTASQAPNGMIHLITTMNHPCLHFELNEAWLLAPESTAPPDDALMISPATRIGTIDTRREDHANGKTRLEWSGGVTDDGRYLKHGTEKWFHPDGSIQYRATYRLGRKIGAEILRGAAGSIEWCRDHREDGVSVWTQYRPDGTKRAESSWREGFADGPALLWNAAGREQSRIVFRNGRAEGLPEGRFRRTAGGARAGARCYLDRDFRISSLPPELAGGDLVLTANEEDHSTGDTHIALELTARSTVYACYWAEARTLPVWLRDPKWKRLEQTVVVDQSPGSRKAYQVFSRSVGPGRLALGGNQRGDTGAESMYFAVISAAD